MKDGHDDWATPGAKKAMRIEAIVWLVVAAVIAIAVLGALIT